MDEPFCLGDDGPKMIVPGMNPGFAPIMFPMMDPNQVLCGPSKPVTHKGVTVCGCKEVINSKIVTNPILQEGQYCISEGKFYIAKKCSAPLDSVHQLEKDRDGWSKEYRDTQKEVDRCLQSHGRKSARCQKLEDKLEELESKLEGYHRQFHEEFDKAAKQNASCELEKASKKDIRLIKWVQKNQRVNHPGGLGMPGMNMPGMNMPGMNMPGMNMPGMGMPGMGMPGMGMPGMGMPVPVLPASGNSDDSTAPIDSGRNRDRDGSKANQSGRGQ